MSDRYQGSQSDLFDFPDPPEFEDFGLVPVTRMGAEDDAADGADAPSEDDVERPPIGTVVEPRANPETPAGVADLDADLFGFDEIFSADDDPFLNGTLDLDGSPAHSTAPGASTDAPAPAEPTVVEPQPLVDAAAAATAEPTIVKTEPITSDRDDGRPSNMTTPIAPMQAQPAPEPVAAAPEAAAEAAPAPAARATVPPPADPITALPDVDLAESLLNIGESLGDGNAPSRAGRDRGPRILLPEDVPYGRPSSRERVVWLLVACFLVMNVAILFLSHRANANFQESLESATDAIADAIVQGGAQSQASTTLFPVDLSYTTEELDGTGEDTEVETPDERDPWVDPRDYSNTHDIAVGTAKAMLEEGRFEEARRLLNHVLANQSRVPLRPSLREEIDYLIPLTYFQQGRATAVEGDER